MHLTRRRFTALAGSGFVSLVLNDACAVEGEPSPANDGRLTARPPSQPAADAKAAQGNRRALGLERGRDAILQLPAKTTGDPLPLFVVLHGAGGSGEGMLRRIVTAADEAGVAVLAPDSRDATWDAIRGSFGRDVAFVDRALARVFEIVSIDGARIAVGGFSDGASYALSLGLVNGDLFHRVVAFSPGFIVEGTAHGKPEFFISHGTADQILPIDRCSRIIVPQLQRRGYGVTFKEFDGGHQVPPDIAGEAMRWVAKT
jgi:phospholipase/carboxylesterase